MSQGVVVLENASAPDAPDASYRALYPKADGWYDLDSAGNDRLLVSGLDVAHTWTAANTFQRTIAVGGGEADVVIVDDITGATNSFISHTHYNNGSTGSAQLLLRSARGTRALPTASQANDNIGGIQARGYGATQFATSSRGYVSFYATENWTDALQGAGLNIGITPTGTITPLTVFGITATVATSFVTAGLGVNDSYGAVLELYGPATGTEGGELRIYNSGDYDTSFQFWVIDSNTEALRVFRGSGGVGGVLLRIAPTTLGGTVYLGGDSDATQFPTQVYINPSAHASSRRVTVSLGGVFALSTDSVGNGTQDFFLYNAGLGATALAFSALNNATFGGSIIAPGSISAGGVAASVTGGIRATMSGAASSPILALYNRAASSGVGILMAAKDSLINDQSQLLIETGWATDTTGTRRAQAFFYIYDSGGARLAIELEAAGAGTGAVAMIGFFGASPIYRPTVTGSRGGNAALASLLTELANYGLITNSTSA